MRKYFKLVEERSNRIYVRENNEYTVRPKTKKELKIIIKETIEEQGNRADLNFIDTSLIDDMSYLFDMHAMFQDSKFNGDISKWDVSNVENMEYMFYNCDFNGDISKWDVRKVKNMKLMFWVSPLEKIYGKDGEKLKLGITESYRRRYRR